MYKILQLLALVGRLCMCFPFQASKNGRTSPFTVLQLILLVYIALLNFEYTFIRDRYHVKPNLSERVRYCLGFVAKGGVDILLRAAVLFLGRDILSLVCFSQALSHTQGMRDDLLAYSRWIGAASLIVLLWIAFSLFYFIPQDLDSFDGDYIFLPQNLVMKRAVMFVCDMMEIISSCYALLFTVTIGLILVKFHGKLLKDFERILVVNASPKSNQSFRNESNLLDQVVGDESEEWAPPGVTVVSLEEFVEQFAGFKSNFSSFSKVAGIYSMGLLTSCMANVLHGLTSVANNPKLEGYGYNTFAKVGVYITHVSHVLCLIYLAAFGRHLSQRVNVQRERLSYYYAKYGSNNLSSETAERIFNHLVSWKCVLLAGDCIELNFNIIPLAIGTVVTYFLVIFQLSFVESTSGRHC